MHRQLEENLLNSNTSSTCPRNMVNFSPLTAEIGWWVWSTPANFSGFCILSSLLCWHLSTEVSQTLHDVWPFAALLQYIYIFGGACPLTEFCQVHSSLCIQVLRSSILAALLLGSRAVGVSQTAARYKEWNYNTFTPRYFQQRVPSIFPWRPSLWA